MFTQEAWIDVGGTFTDCILRKPDGSLLTHKLLSTGVYKRRALAGEKPGLLLLEGEAGTPAGFFEHCTARWAPGQEAQVLAQSGEGAAPLELTLANSSLTPPPTGSIVELVFAQPAPVVGLRWLLGLSAAEAVPPLMLRLGTTRATNALLEGKGARVVLVTTKGFGDVLAIGHQERPHLFALNIARPKPLASKVIEVDERTAVDGSILKSFDEAKLADELAQAYADGAEAVAVAFLHATRQARHETMAAACARRVGFNYVSLSHEAAPEPRFIARVESTVTDAYLTPVLRSYLNQIETHLPGCRLQLMTSGGGLVGFAAARGLNAILSGPAGGAVGVSRVAHLAEQEHVLGFDMGGTSTDVCRVAQNAIDRRYLTEHKDERTGGMRRLLAPTIAVETVAAGGGSICHFDGTQLVVGPHSAGADPGPACYGRGGPLTVTDLVVVLGRVPPLDFAFPLDLAAAKRRLEELSCEVAAATGFKPEPEVLAEQLLTVAASAMAEVIRRVSLARGHDPREHALVSFGGAGAQHACQLAGLLGMRRILQHPLSSLLSAYGCGVSSLEREMARPLGQNLDEAKVAIEGAFHELEEQVRQALIEDGGVPSRFARPQRSLDLRYRGQDACLTIDEPDDAQGELNVWQQAFTAKHREHYGFIHKDRSIEVCTARLRLACRSETAEPPPRQKRAGSRRTTRAAFLGEWQEVPLLASDELGGETCLEGPAIITGDATTIVVMPGWTARRLISGLIEMIQVDAARKKPVVAAQDAAPDFAATRQDSAENGSQQSVETPMRLALYTHRLTAIAERMGQALRQTALSVNIKERLDFSCAIFDAEGRLVVNAPHIPVHLGAMGETVRALMAKEAGNMRDGDAYLTNDPFAGGSHLPDITVITPVFAPGSGAGPSSPIFYAANRAHHAEIGGMTPGSMPPFATRLGEEGVLIKMMPLVRAGERCTEEVRTLLCSGVWPSRDPDSNLADLDAQLAANMLGHRLLLEMIAERGLDEALYYPRLLQEAAKLRTANALSKLAEGERRHADMMDDGTPVVVTVTIEHRADGGFAKIDFTGTGAPNASNLNANPAIVRAAVLYVLRCLVAEELPLNEGVLDRVELVIPSPSLLSPKASEDPANCPAVALGNVETSQRLCDILLAAFGLCAASQGTMNNLLFGPAEASQRRFSHYETICGGAGAGRGFP